MSRSSLRARSERPWCALRRRGVSPRVAPRRLVLFAEVDVDRAGSRREDCIDAGPIGFERLVVGRGFKAQWPDQNARRSAGGVERFPELDPQQAMLPSSLMPQVLDTPAAS